MILKIAWAFKFIMIIRVVRFIWSNKVIIIIFTVIMSIFESQSYVIRLIRAINY